MNYLPIKLVKLRKHYNYSQGKLAEVLGVDTLEYMGYENGRLVLNYDQIKKLASFYHVDFEDIFRNDAEVLLHEVSENTDELNIEYFIPHYNIFQKAWNFIKRHPLVVGILTLSIVLLSTTVFLFNKYLNELPFEIVRGSSNYLSASNTTVAFIDKRNGVNGNGDNSNGQLSSLPNSNIAKVLEGKTFTVMLDENGKISSAGLGNRLAEEIASWENIIDVAVGDNHILALDYRGRTFCAGDNSYEQCKLSDFNNLKRIFASKNGSVGIKKDDRVVTTGDVFGASLIKNLGNIIDMDFSNDNTIVLKEDGSVAYYAKSKQFVEAETWRNIKAVACGDDFVAALNEEGKVLISIDNNLYKKEVESWQEIISIAAGDDYLVAYDGENIFGIGNNTYNQFDISKSLIQTLPQVSDVNVTIENDNAVVHFKGVRGAKGYLVAIDAGIGHSIYVVNDQDVSFDAFIFEEDKNYTVLITTIGEKDYENSSPLSYNFTYHKEENNAGEQNFVIDALIGKTKNNFEAYFRGLNYDVARIEAIQSDTPCSKEEPEVLSVTGIYEGESLTLEELQARNISYTYCKLENTNE